MSTGPDLLAALSIAAAVFVATPEFRLQPQVMEQRGRAMADESGWRRHLARRFAAVEGAPSTWTRVAGGVIAACALLMLGRPGPEGMPLAVVAGLIIFVGLGRWSPAEVRERDRIVQAALPGASTLLAGCLEAGLPLRKAVSLVVEATQGPLADALRRLDTAVRLGASEPDAWRELGEAQPAFADLARELGHASMSGMALAPVLRNHSREAQRAVHGAAQARARKAGVSSVFPLMVCFLPAFILVGVVPIVGGVVIRMIS